MRCVPLLALSLALTFSLTMSLTGCANNGTSYRTLPPEQQQVQQVHEFAGLPKGKTMMTVQAWFLQHLKDVHPVPTGEDLASGTLKYQVQLPHAIPDPMGLTSFPLRMDITFEIKDGKYRTTYENFWLAADWARDVATGDEMANARKMATMVDNDILAAVAAVANAKDF